MTYVFATPALLLQISETYVAGWGVPGEALAAISYQTRGPVLIIDSVFDSPFNASSSVIFLRNSTSDQPDKGVGGSGGMWESIILVNSTTRGPSGPLLDPVTTSNLTHLYSCYEDQGCAGDPTIAAQLAPLSINTQFFNAMWRVPGGKVFDAVRDFNASNRVETSAALQACIDAAAAEGNGAICYLPQGSYVVNKTLSVCGTNWTLMGAGSGFMTQVGWKASDVSAS